MHSGGSAGGFFSWLGIGGNRYESERFSSQVVQDAIDLVVEVADPRIRQVRRYQRKLALPVIDALGYCTDLVASIKGPVRLSRKQYHADPVVKALFSSPDELEEVLRLAFVNVGEVITAANDETIALMTMTRTEKTIFTHGQDGGMVIRDMQKRAVSFGDHRVVAPAADIEQLKAQLRTRAVEVLATVAMEKIAGLKGNLAELRERRVRLRSMLTMLGGRTHNRELLARPSQEMNKKIQKVKEELKRVDSKIEDLRKMIELPQDSLALLIGCLDRAAELFATSEKTLRLDWMNVRIEEGSSLAEGNDIEFTELSVRDEMQRSAVLVSFVRDGVDDL